MFRICTVCFNRVLLLHCGLLACQNITPYAWNKLEYFTARFGLTIEYCSVDLLVGWCTIDFECYEGFTLVFSLLFCLQYSLNVCYRDSICLYVYVECCLSFYPSRTTLEISILCYAFRCIPLELLFRIPKSLIKHTAGIRSGNAWRNMVK